MRLAESRRREFLPPAFGRIQAHHAQNQHCRECAAATDAPRRHGRGDPLMLLPRFDPPGFLDDFDEGQSAAWSTFISAKVDAAIRGRPDLLLDDGPRGQFFNPDSRPIEDDAVAEGDQPDGFPRQVQVDSISDLQRWRRADGDRNLQDEYCEWSVERDPQTRKIRRVTFTCEGPDMRVPPPRRRTRCSPFIGNCRSRSHAGGSSSTRPAATTR